MGCERKISRDLRQSPRISDSVSWTFLPGLEPRTAKQREIVQLLWWIVSVMTLGEKISTICKRESIRKTNIVYIRRWLREREVFQRLGNMCVANESAAIPGVGLARCSSQFASCQTPQSTHDNYAMMHSSSFTIESSLTFQKSGYDVIDVEYISNIRHIWVSLNRRIGEEKREEKKWCENISAKFHNLSMWFSINITILACTSNSHWRWRCLWSVIWTFWCVKTAFEKYQIAKRKFNASLSTVVHRVPLKLCAPLRYTVKTPLLVKSKIVG